MLPIYRGRRENGTWISGCLVYDPESMQVLGIISNDPDVHPLDMPYMDAGCIDGRFPTVDPETIGMCTGLKDRNDQWIFEGDIIRTHYANAPKSDFVEQVAFHNGRFCGMYERDKMKMWAALPDGIKRLPQDKSVYMEWCEVIGNIHDNPKLLEARV